MKGKEKLEFEVHGSRVVHKAKYFEVRVEEVSLPGKPARDMTVVYHPGAIIVVPIDREGNLFLIDQYRHSLRHRILEFPAGTLEQNENPLDCAKREIMEEIGYRADSWKDLGTLIPAPGFCNEIQYLFLASDLAPEKREADDDELISVKKMRVKEVEEAIARGAINDGKTIASFARAKLMGLLPS